MAIDKRIHELVETSDKTGRFVALDEAGLSEALKFNADLLIDKATTDTLYVKLTGNETVNGLKTWNNLGTFEAGILVNAGGIEVTGDSHILGELGIGTVAPAYQIEMVNAGNALMHLRSGNSSWAGIYFGDTDLAARGRIYYNNSLESLSFSTSSSVRMTLDGSGKLGIGIALPLEKLHVAGTGALIQMDANAGLKGTTSNPNTIILYNNTTARMDFNCTYATTSLGGFNFQRNGTLSMLIRGDGHIGIGTASPAYKLVISDGGLTGLEIDPTASGGTQVSILAYNRSAAGYRKLYFDCSEYEFNRGNVGIGTGSATAALQVKPASGVAIKIERSGGEASIKASGADTSMMIDSNGAQVGLNWYVTDNVILCNGGGNVGVGTSTTVGALTLDQSLSNFSGRGVITEDTGFSGMKLYDQSSGNLIIFNKQNTSGFGNIIFSTGGAPTEYMRLTYLGQLQVNDATVYGSTQKVTFGNNAAHLAWADFPTALPSNRGLYLNRTSGFYGSNDYQAIMLHARGSSSNSSYGIIALSAEGTGLPSKMNFMLRGTSTSDYRTIMTLMHDEIQLKGELSSSDVPIRFYQGATQKFHVGFDDTNEQFQINHGTSFSTGTGTYGFSVLGSRNRLIVGRDYDGDSQVSFQTNYDKGSATWAMVLGNAIDEAYAYGLRLPSGLNTPTTTVCYTLHANDGNLGGVGTLEWNTTSGFRLVNSLSSKNFKKNIKKTKIKGVEKLKAVRPKNYKWKGRTPEEEVIITAAGEDKEMEGYIVEELEAVIPDAVSKYTDPYTGVEVKGYADTALIKYLHQAILELEARLAVLEP